VTHLIQIVAELAAQVSSASSEMSSSQDHPSWPYWVAIGALSTALTTVFGLLMKSTKEHNLASRNHAEEIKVLNKGYNEANDERAKRISEEFAKKDKALLETSVEFAKIMERTAADLSRIGDDLSRLSDNDRR
jgi:hypothetical protein